MKNLIVLTCLVASSPAFAEESAIQNPMLKMISGLAWVKTATESSSGFGTCYNNLNCSGSTVAMNVSADQCRGYGGFSLAYYDGSGCVNLN